MGYNRRSFNAGYRAGCEKKEDKKNNLLVFLKKFYDEHPVISLILVFLFLYWLW